MGFYEIMKKSSIISICVCAAIIASLGLLFLDDENNPFFTDSSKKIVNQLERNDIQAFAMLTRDDAWGNEKSASITELFFVNDMLAPKIEIIYDPENPNYTDMSINLSMAIKEHLNNYNSSEIAVIVIGFEEKEKEFLEIAIYGDNLKLSELEWIWISE